jgi:hypothetical protein
MARVTLTGGGAQCRIRRAADAHLVIAHGRLTIGL